MKASEILAGVIALFKFPSHWTQRAYARAGKDGPPADITNPAATCFCLTGAVRKVGKNGQLPLIRQGELARQYLREAIRLEGYHSMGVVEFNDTPGRKIKDVRAVVKKAHRLALDAEARQA